MRKFNFAESSGSRKIEKGSLKEVNTDLQMKVVPPLNSDVVWLRNKAIDQPCGWEST